LFAFGYELKSITESQLFSRFRES